MTFSNRITQLTGTQYPIIQAPMGWIARAQLASAVSNAGGLGVIETSSGELDNIKLEVAKMRQLTDKPFGMNVALSYVRDSNIIDQVCHHLLGQSQCLYQGFPGGRHHRFSCGTHVGDGA
jgi:enoyl-[acyl-carrier protein] reductase II